RRIVERAAIRKTVGRDVENAHDQRPVEHEPGPRRARRRQNLERGLDLGGAPGARSHVLQFGEGEELRRGPAVRAALEHFHSGEGKRSAGKRQRAAARHRVTRGGAGEYFLGAETTVLAGHAPGCGSGSRPPAALPDGGTEERRPAARFGSSIGPPASRTIFSPRITLRISSADRVSNSSSPLARRCS